MPDDSLAEYIFLWPTKYLLQIITHYLSLMPEYRILACDSGWNEGFRAKASYYGALNLSLSFGTRDARSASAD